MKSIYLTLIAFLSVMTTVNAQVGIGTNSPEGALDVVSTTGGLVPPRMTQAQRDALTAGMRPTGAIIYNTTKNCMQTNEGNSDKPSWSCLQIFTPDSGNEVMKQLYSGSGGDSAKTVTIGDFVFRFSQGGVNKTKPQISLKAKPGANVNIFVGVNKQLQTDLFKYTNSSHTFTPENFNAFQDISQNEPNMKNYELNLFHIVDATNDRYYRVTFYISGPENGNKSFMIIAEKF